MKMRPACTAKNIGKYDSGFMHMCARKYKTMCDESREGNMILLPPEEI
jgi:hypothetical protein